MFRSTILACLALGGMICFAACSDDTIAKDNSVDSKQSPDLVQYVEAGPDATPDAPLDSVVDAPPDVGSVDSDVGAKEAAAETSTTDAATDTALKDAAADASGDAKGDAKPGDLAPDLGAPVVMGYISRSVIPVNDGKGDIHVGLSAPSPWPFPPLSVGSALIKGADLRKPGAKVKYTLYSGVAAGKYTLSAWMDDNNNAWVPFQLADFGDLVMSKAKTVNFGGSAAVQMDIVLDKMNGGLSPTDAGSSAGALKGKITAKVAPALDGKGAVWISLHNKVPPAGLVGSATWLPGGDLSSPFASEAYYLPDLKAGQYYLRVFLDDNSNAGLLNTNPSKNDMIHSKAIQVHVSSGVVTVHDVVLDSVKK